MKLSNLAHSCLLLASATWAAPTAMVETLDRRDLASISGVLNNIMRDLVAMTAAIKAFDGNAELAVPVLEAAEKTLADIRAGKPIVAQSAELNLGESIGILLPVGALQAAAKQLVTDIVAKKAQFDSSGTTIVVQEKLGEFQREAGELVVITIKKIPAYLSIISTPIAGTITSQLDTAATAFGLQASAPLDYASLGDVASSLGALFAKSNSTTEAAAPVPAPAPAASSGFSLASLFGGGASAAPAPAPAVSSGFSLASLFGGS